MLENLRNGLVLDVDFGGHNPIDRSVFGHRLNNFGSIWDFNGRRFDGVDDEIYIGNNDVLNLTDALTIIACINPTTATEAGYIISKTSNGATNSGYALYFDGSNNKLSTFVTNPSVSSTDIFTEFNELIFIGMTYNGKNITFFKDGIGIINTISVTIPLNTADIVIANRVGGSSAATYFNGKIRCISIWNRVLTTMEIQQLYLKYKNTKKI